MGKKYSELSLFFQKALKDNLFANLSWTSSPGICRLCLPQKTKDSDEKFHKILESWYLLKGKDYQKENYSDAKQSMRGSILKSSHFNVVEGGRDIKTVLEFQILNDEEIQEKKSLKAKLKKRPRDESASDVGKNSPEKKKLRVERKCKSTKKPQCRESDLDSDSGISSPGSSIDMHGVNREPRTSLHAVVHDHEYVHMESGTECSKVFIVPPVDSIPMESGNGTAASDMQSSITSYTAGIQGEQPLVDGTLLHPPLIDAAYFASILDYHSKPEPPLSNDLCDLKLEELSPPLNEDDWKTALDHLDQKMDWNLCPAPTDVTGVTLPPQRYVCVENSIFGGQKILVFKLEKPVTAVNVVNPDAVCLVMDAETWKTFLKFDYEVKPIDGSILMMLKQKEAISTGLLPNAESLNIYECIKG